MVERAIVICPTFENMQIINNIRKKYDPLEKLISPHITLVFPFESELSKDELALRLQVELAEQHSFSIELSGISKHVDSFGNYLFLNLTQGYNETTNLYKRLYKSIFNEDKNLHMYVPHITIGKFDSLDMLEDAYGKVVGVTDTFRTVVDTISVNVIEKKEDSILKIENEINYSLKQMERITYKNTKDFNKNELQDLFLSVEWSSGHYPEKLVVAMKNFGSVFSAWDGDKLVGLISSMDDGVMTAYIHYLLVNPEYQGKGIGKKLLKIATENYKSYLRIVLVAYDKEIKFYKHCGFVPADEKTPMFITSLWT